MTVHRRTLPLLLGLLAGPTAGCITFGKPVPVTPPDQKPPAQVTEQPSRPSGFAAPLVQHGRRIVGAAEDQDLEARAQPAAVR